jgi:hypothetical protein
MGQKKLYKNTIQKALDWCYDKAVNGVPGLDSAEELAQSYMKEGGSNPPATIKADSGRGNYRQDKE